jgi:hypothetical protein
MMVTLRLGVVSLFLCTTYVYVAESFQTISTVCRQRTTPLQADLRKESDNRDISNIFEANKRWRNRKLKGNKQYFVGLDEGFAPKYLWIGKNADVEDILICCCCSCCLLLCNRISHLLAAFDINFRLHRCQCSCP